MTIDLYIGPLVERAGGFGYDTFSRREGRRASFHYQRVEQARHDRRAMIAESRSTANIRVHVCDTLAQFERSIAPDEDADEDPGAPQ